MIKRAVSGLVFSNLFVALVLSTLTAASYACMPWLKWQWYVPISVFLGAFMLYSFHRLYKVDFIPMDQLSNRHLWVLARESHIKMAMSFALFGLMLLLPSYEADAIVWLVPAAIVSIGYTIPVLPTKSGWQRFRDLPLTKPLIIASVVTYLTLCFPVFEQFGIAALGSAHVMALGAERLIFLLAVTLPFDLRDIKNDKAAGLHTLGTDFGFESGKRLGLFLVVAWIISCLVLLFNGGISFSLFWAKTALAASILWATIKLNENWTEQHYVLVFEGSILIYSLAYFMVD